MEENKQKLVSVIIPTHNRSGLIINTLDSFLAQDYGNLELIVVNDHSGDDTRVVVEKYIAEHVGNVFLFDSPGFGACAARNYGLSLAKGDYIQFFDDDDLTDPRYISLRVAAIQRDKADFAACNYSYFNHKSGEFIRAVDICGLDHTISAHLYHTALSTQCFLLTRKCAEQIGEWNESIRRCQDMAYFHRLFLFECTGTWVPQQLFSLRVHEKQISSDSPKSIVAMIESYQAIKSEWRMKNNQGVNNVLTYMQISAIKRLFAIHEFQASLSRLYRLFFKSNGDVWHLMKIGLQNRTFKLSFEMLTK